MYENEGKNIFLNFICSWFAIRKSMYFILIRDIFYCENNKQIMIKYQCSNKRIGDIVSLESFMQSPLKHATHPEQLFHLGIQAERFLSKIRNTKNSSSDMQDQLTRFKRLFYK